MLTAVKFMGSIGFQEIELVFVCNKKMYVRAPIRKGKYVRMDKDNHQIIFPFEQRKLAYKKLHKRNMKVFLRNHANFFSFSLFDHKQQKPSSNDKKWHKGSPDPQERKLQVQIQINKIQLNQQKTRMTNCPISKGLNFLRNHDTTMVESTATKKLLKVNEMVQIL